MAKNLEINSFTGRRAGMVVSLVAVTAMLIFVISSAGSRAAAESNSPENVMLSLEPFATGLNSPLSITNAGDDRLFVNEKAGRIKIVLPDGTVVLEPFLDITERVTSEGEEGFLGLAFHPEYAENGFFYVNYTNMTNNVRRTRISRFEVSDDPNVANPNSEDILLTVVQPGFNHNAGDIHFGPDGYLYIPLGDGGSGGDPENAQNLETLLGKILRIDVDSLAGNLLADCYGDGSGHYRVPTTIPKNPYIDNPNACDEIWASGLRNPWRSSFDTITGDFYIGDVGQNKWEEINFQPADSTGGENYGWPCYEGNHEYNTSGCGSVDKHTFPIFEYAHAGDPCSASVTGGYVYRGSKYPNLNGRYFLADFCKGNFWDLARTGENWQATEHLNLTEPGYSAFGEDSRGEIYLANMFNGNIYHLEGDFDVVGYLPLILRPGP